MGLHSIPGRATGQGAGAAAWALDRAGGTPYDNSPSGGARCLAPRPPNIPHRSRNLPMTTRTLTPIALAALAAGLALPTASRAAEEAAPRPLKALYITGGCCHDYTAQKKIFTEGVSARARVEWTVVQEGGQSTDHRISLYEKPGWADGYDVVVHNECFSAVGDPKFIENVLAPHRAGLPAVVIHCSMHTFRDVKGEAWHEFLGVSTNHHGPQQPLGVKNLEPSDPIMKGFPQVWTTGNEELYSIDKVEPHTTVLAEAYALDEKKQNAVIWHHSYGKGRVFGSTIAHNNATMKDPVYLDLVTRGLLWSTGHLDAEGKAEAGYGVAGK